MKTKSFFILAALAGLPTGAVALTPGAACPGVSGWYIYNCDCRNDGEHWSCRSDIASSGQTTCYIQTYDGGDGDECTWICSSQKNADPCTVCKCPQTEDWMESFPENYVSKRIYNNTYSSYSCKYVSDVLEQGCAAGYYMNSDEECVECPKSGGIAGMNEIGTTDITTCYIPAGKIGNDGTGTFAYTGDCYYTK